MGTSFGYICRKCGYSAHYELGMGLTTKVIDSLTTDFDLVDRMRSIPIRTKVTDLMLHHQGKVMPNSEGKCLYFCPYCMVLYDRLSFQVQSDLGLYQPTYGCPTCHKILKKVSMERLVLRQFRCPKCKSKALINHSKERIKLEG